MLQAHAKEPEHFINPLVTSSPTGSSTPPLASAPALQTWNTDFTTLGPQQQFQGTGAMLQVEAAGPSGLLAVGSSEANQEATDRAIASVLQSEQDEFIRQQAAAAAAASVNDAEFAIQAQEEEVDRLMAQQRGDLVDLPPEVVSDRRLDLTLSRSLQRATSVQLRPRVNSGLAPTPETVISDRQRLQGRLDMYGLEERLVSGDGNCQFRALSDQLYRTPEHHRTVREKVVKQLRRLPDRYSPYVPMDSYAAYCADMARQGTWGDHVTLQAAADCYGLGVHIITSFPSTCVIDIEPAEVKSQRALWLSFWAEVHYNSIYPVDSDLAHQPASSGKVLGSRRLGMLLGGGA